MDRNQFTKSCTFKRGAWNCGSYQFNLQKNHIDQGDLCDVHYWQTQAQRPWVGLTDDDKTEIKKLVTYDQFETAGEYANRVQAATESKLREKNK